jgi:hypothetical protein
MGIFFRRTFIVVIRFSNTHSIISRIYFLVEEKLVQHEMV